MSRYERPYQGAALVRSQEFSVPGDYGNAEMRGGRAVLRLWDGLASQGYKTSYERKPVRWLEAESFTLGGMRFARQCWRYTGKRYDRADLDWRKLCADLQMEGCSPLAPRRAVAS